MSIVLNRIDSTSANEFDVQFLQWVWVLIDSLNENIVGIENAFNLFSVTHYTQAQITAMQTAGQLSDGTVLYDSTNDVYVGREAGSLVKFTTTAYP